MMSHPPSLQSRRRTGRRYTILLFIVLALIAGWTGFWKFAASKAQEAIEGWRAREAKAGRIYNCGSQDVGGFPFRIEVNCDDASALFRSNQPPVELRRAASRRRAGLSARPAHQRNSMVRLTFGDPGKSPDIRCRLDARAIERARYAEAPQRASLVFDLPIVDRLSGAARQNILRAKHIEIHGRMAEGSAANKPVIEIALQLDQASAPTLHPAAARPIDANVTALLRGLNDFSPKPWPVRFARCRPQAAASTSPTHALQQGDILAVGGGTLSLNSNGRLEGQLRVTMAGLEQFLAAIGAQQRVQNVAEHGQARRCA